MPSSVTILSVTKFRPGLQTITFASTIRMASVHDPKLARGPRRLRRFDVGAFRVLLLLGDEQVLAHQLLGPGVVTRADGLVDLAMHGRGLAQIARAVGRPAPALVEERRHHFNERRENRI